MQKRLVKLELYVNYILIKLGGKNWVNLTILAKKKKTKTASTIYTRSLKYTKYSIKDSDIIIILNYYY